MANFSIQNFKSTVLYRGVAKTNRFEVNFNIPFTLANKLGGIGSGSGAEGILRTVSLYCEISSLPSKNLNVVQQRIYGPLYQNPISVDYGGDAITMTFYVDRDMNVKKFFDAWTEYIIDDANYTVRYQKGDRDFYEAYIQPIDIFQLNEQDQPTYAIKLVDAFPRNIGILELNAASLNTPHRLNVTFAYRKWVTIDLKTNRTKNTPSATFQNLSGTGGAGVNPLESPVVFK